MAEHELEVRLETRACQVRGAGQDPALLAAEEDRLGVQEVPLVAAHLDPPRAQKVEERADRAVLLEVEGQQVAVVPQSSVELPERLPDATARELGLGRVIRRAPGKERLGRRVGPEQEPDAGNMPRLALE